jgi:hypothetical protein
VVEAPCSKPRNLLAHSVRSFPLGERMQVRGDFEGNHPWVVSLRATNGSVAISLITDYEFVGALLAAPFFKLLF